VLKEMGAAKRARLVAAARLSPMADPAVRYPRWYLQRWHFLPEGYFSERSVRWYERLILPLYNMGQATAVYAAVAREIAGTEPLTIVQLGCGPGVGIETVRATSPEAEVIGIDLSPFMLEAARARLGETTERVRLIHADARSIPLESGSVDAVFAVHVLGHVPHRAADAMAKDVARLLRPGGRLVLVDHRWHRLPQTEGLFTVSSRRSLVGRVLALTVFERNIGPM